MTPQSTVVLFKPYRSESKDQEEYMDVPVSQESSAKTLADLLIGLLSETRFPEKTRGVLETNRGVLAMQLIDPMMRVAWQEIIDACLKFSAHEFSAACNTQNRRRIRIEVDILKDTRKPLSVEEIDSLYKDGDDADMNVHNKKIRFWAIHRSAGECGFRTWPHHEAYLALFVG